MVYHIISDRVQVIQAADVGVESTTHDVILNVKTVIDT